MRYLIPILVLLLSGCEADTFSQLNERNPQWLVVDGWMSNQPQTHTVELTRTRNYRSEVAPPLVEDALITLYGPGGSIELDETSPGFYTTPENFALSPGGTYIYEIALDSVTHRYSTTVPPATELLELEVFLGDSTVEGDATLASIPNTDGYLFPRLYLITVNDTDSVSTEIGPGIQLEDAEVVTFGADGTVVVDFSIEGVVIPEGAQYLLVEVHSVNAQLFNYLTNLQQDISGDLFSPYAANPPAMFDNEALGVVFNSTVDRQLIEL